MIRPGFVEIPILRRQTRSNSGNPDSDYFCIGEIIVSEEFYTEWSRRTKLALKKETEETKPEFPVLRLEYGFVVEKGKPKVVETYIEFDYQGGKVMTKERKENEKQGPITTEEFLKKFGFSVEEHIHVKGMKYVY